MGTSGKIYANAVAKYNEGRLLDAEKLRRITDAEYFDALKMLYDYGYGEGIAIENADATRLVENENAKLLQFVDEYTDDENLRGFLLCSQLYNNLKASVKSRFTDVEESAYYPVFSEEGDKVKNKVYDDLSEKAVCALKQIDEIVDENENISSRRIDEILTKAQYADELYYAKKVSKNAFKYALYKIDCKNLTTVMRCRKMNVPTSSASEMYIDGGKITKETLDEMLTLDESKLCEIVPDEYYDDVNELISGGVPSFERNTDDKLFEILVRDRENMTSYDPFIGYYFAKKREIEAVKLILICIKNGVQGEIRRRLRNVGE